MRLFTLASLFLLTIFSAELGTFIYWVIFKASYSSHFFTTCFQGRTTIIIVALLLHFLTNRQVLALILSITLLFTSIRIKIFFGKMQLSFACRSSPTYPANHHLLSRRISLHELGSSIRQLGKCSNISL